MTAIIIKILKVLEILFIALIVVTVISIVVFVGVRTNVNTESEKTEVLITESVGEEKYIIEIGSDGSFKSTGLSAEMKDDIIDMIDYDDLEKRLHSVGIHPAEELTKLGSKQAVFRLEELKSFFKQL